MEVHMVHQSADGHSLVLGLLLEHSANVFKQNAFLHDLLELPFASDEIATGLLMNPYAGTMKEGDQFYSFLGSLTTPPCTPNLEWIVMREPILIQAATIERFESFLQTWASQADSYGHDNRPVQPLNGRQIKLGNISMLA